MSETTLRQLAKKYAKNLIDKTEYRQARGEFISAVIEGSISLTENTYLPPVEVDNEKDCITETRDRDTTQIRTSPPPSPPSPKITEVETSDPTAPKKQSDSTLEERKPLPWMGIAIATTTIAVLILITLILMTEKTDESQNAPIASKQTEQKTEVPPSTASNNRAGDKIIDDFLTQKSWQDDALNNFKTKWDELTPEQTAATSNSGSIKRLTNAVYRQLLEEQSLATIGDSEAALQRQKQLIDFVSHLNIDDPRLHALLIEIKKN